MIQLNKIFLTHIQIAIKEIEKFINGVGWEDFLKNTEKQSAIIRQLEIIGEAVKNLPEEFKNAHLNIPWRDIASMRDNLIHEYFGVDLKVVWKTSKEDLLVFKKQIENLLNEETDSQQFRG